MGNLCLPASFLSKAGVRKDSYPFDWVFSSPLIVKSSIESHFDRWLIDELLVSASPIRRCGHLEYGPENFFNHHDPSIEPDRETYKRRIERFEKLYYSSSAILFLTSASADSLIQVGLDSLLSLRNAPTAVLCLSTQARESETQPIISYTLNTSNISTLNVKCIERFTDSGYFSNGLDLADEEAESALINFFKLINRRLEEDPQFNLTNFLAGEFTEL